VVYFVLNQDGDTVKASKALVDYSPVNHVLNEHTPQAALDEGDSMALQETLQTQACFHQSRAMTTLSALHLILCLRMTSVKTSYSCINNSMENVRPNLSTSHQ
jgi:hypothetical protein